MVLSVAAIVEYSSDIVFFRDPLKELVRDLVWICTGAWFLANALRFLDTMRHGVWRYLLLVGFGGLLIWFGYTTVETYLGYGADDVSELASISAAVFTVAIGVLAIFSLLRRGSERADTPTDEGGAGESFRNIESRCDAAPHLDVCYSSLSQHQARPYPVERDFGSRFVADGFFMEHLCVAAARDSNGVFGSIR